MLSPENISRRFAEDATLRQGRINALSLAFHSQACGGDIKAMQRLLDDGAHPNVQGGPYNRTALMEVADKGKLEAVIFLLEVPDINLIATDKGGKTAAAIAEQSGQYYIADLIRKKSGLTPDGDRSIQGSRPANTVSLSDRRRGLHR
jgi:ankyrin repeat protein